MRDETGVRGLVDVVRPSAHCNLAQGNAASRGYNKDVTENVVRCVRVVWRFAW